MGVRSLISFGLFVLPIAVTLSVLLAVDLPRHSNGQQSIFAPPPNNKVTTDTFCQLAYGFTPDPGRYTYNPNQWGVHLIDPNADGNLCMNVTFHENGTYVDKATAPSFAATWEYPQGPESQPVHAFPNVKIEIPEILNTTTVQISDLSSIPVSLAWSYGVGKDAASVTDTPALVSAELNANICFDIFLDEDPDQAVMTNTSTYEVMVWFGAYGLSTQPIGNLQGIKATKTVGDTVFNLYSGQNSNTGQKVFTWLTSGNVTEFSGDLGELVTELEAVGGPVATDHLGYIAFGSEALYSFEEVTFAVSELSFDLVTG